MLDQDTTRSLLEKLKNESWEIRARCKEELRQGVSPEAEGDLLTAMNDEDLETREAAAEALWSSSSEDSSAALLRALDDPEWEVQWAAIRSLGRRHEDEILEALGSSDQEERRSAARAMRGRVSPHRIAPLLAALNDESASVRAAAMKTLGLSINLEAHQDRLLPLLKDDDPDVAAAAEQALTQLSETHASSLPVRDLEAIGRCNLCREEMPVAFLKALGSYEAGTEILCEAHFAERQEKVIAAEGKLRACKRCKASWPRVEIAEALCPPCRREVFIERGAAPAGKIRCFRCLKALPERSFSPVKEQGEPICHRCAHSLATATPVPPFHSHHAVTFLNSAEQEGFLLCKKCKKFKDKEQFDSEAWFRKKTVCETCEKRKK